MKVLYFFKEYDSIMYGWQRFQFIDELRHHDINIQIFNPLKYSGIYEANEVLLREIDSGNYDLFMTCHNEETLYISTLQDIKNKGIPTLLFCPDNLLIPYFYKKISKYFDLVWLTSVETEYLFKRWKSNTIFLPYAANPTNFSPEYKQEINKICFIGTPYGSRKRIINHLINNDCQLELYANLDTSNKDSKPYIYKSGDIFFDYFKHKIGRRIILGSIAGKFNTNEHINVNSEKLVIKNPVSYNEGINLYSRYSLALSSTSARNTGYLRNPVNIINLRSFEIPMSGGIQFCAYNPEISNYFEDGKEIILYNSDYELIEKAKFYLTPDKDKLRLEMKKNARKRAETDHSWICRFNKVFNKLF